MYWNRIAAAALFLVAASAPSALAQQPTADQQAQMKAYMDAMRKDLRTERQAIVDQAMGLDAGEKAKFWGVYEKYQTEVKALWDKRIAGIKKYADNFETITPAMADELAAGAIANQEQALALIKKYHPLMKQAVGSKAAARFAQVEHTLNSLGNVQIGSNIPLMPR
jgi:hypothetical protein